VIGNGPSHARLPVCTTLEKASLGNPQELPEHVTAANLIQEIADTEEAEEKCWPLWTASRARAIGENRI